MSSSVITCRRTLSFCRMFSSSAMYLMISAYSSRIFCRSRADSRRSCRSRIACAWMSENSRLADRPFQVLSGTASSVLSPVIAAPCFLISLSVAKLPVSQCSRLVDRTRIADQRNDVIERVDRLVQALQDMGTRLSLSQIEFGPAPDDLASKLDKRLEHLLEIQNAAAGRPRSRY